MVTGITIYKKWGELVMKYNYVIFATDNDYYKVAYKDVIGLEEVKYIWRELDSEDKFLTFLYKLHTSPMTNKFFDLPLKKIWNQKMFKNTFKNNKPICFIFFPGRRKEYNNGLIEYLRKTYKNSKFVLFYQDLVKKSKMPEIEMFKKQFDLVLSFDHRDAMVYSLDYYPLVYSPIDIPVSEISESDVYFVGKAKDRLDEIRESYNIFRNAGLRCDFHVTGVSQEDVKEDGIIYNQIVPYIENLQRIKATRCMLEIMQKDGHGFTLRYCEAIMYGKKIITNNPEIKEAPFYSEQRIQVFENPQEITDKFVMEGEEKVDYGYKDKLSPKRLLDFLDNKL